MGAGIELAPDRFKCNHYMIVNSYQVVVKLPEPKTPRSPGLHVSGIIRCMATEAGILKPDLAEELSLVDVRDITDPVATLRISIGLAWEEHYIPTHLGPLGVDDHPGEYQVDGVYMTPDGESLDVIITSVGARGAQFIVHECKATYKSTKTVGDLTTQSMWMWQIMAYCRALKTRFAKLHVLFLCGDYIFPITPQLWCYELEFTQEEIDSNWRLLMDYRDERLALEAAE